MSEVVEKALSGPFLHGGEFGAFVQRSTLPPGPITVNSTKREP